MASCYGDSTMAKRIVYLCCTPVSAANCGSSPRDCGVPRAAWPATWSFSVAVTSCSGRAVSWDVVSQVQITNPFAGLRTDLERTAQAFVIAELLDAATPDAHPQPELYETLLDSLSAIEQQPRPDVAALQAQIHLLARFGFRPELQRCIHCRGRAETVENFMDVRRGGVLCPDCATREAGGHAISVRTPASAHPAALRRLPERPPEGLQRSCSGGLTGDADIVRACPGAVLPLTAVRRARAGAACGVVCAVGV